MDGETIDDELATIEKDTEMLEWVSQVTVDEFIFLCLNSGFHPRDAASEMGMQYAIFVAARVKFKELAPCWDNLADRPRGGMQLTSTRMRSGQEIKDQLRNRIWSRFEGKLCRMVDRITDDEKGDETVMLLLRNRIIADTLPREQVQRIDQTIITEGNLDKLTLEELQVLYAKGHEKLKKIENKVQIARVINAENTEKNQEKEAG